MVRCGYNGCTGEAPDIHSFCPQHEKESRELAEYFHQGEDHERYKRYASLGVFLCPVHEEPTQYRNPVTGEAECDLCHNS